jgi:hypothetical protein
MNRPFNISGGEGDGIYSILIEIVCKEEDIVGSRFTDFLGERQ